MLVTGALYVITVSFFTVWAGSGESLFRQLTLAVLVMLATSSLSLLLAAKDRKNLQQDEGGVGQVS